MPKKDPAFLFYPKDWIQGTSTMMPDEKGVYIDLLCHQHQDSDLPSDTKRLARMVGMQESEFLKIWDVIGKKFRLTTTNRLVNQKLNQISNERLTKSTAKKITGTFASIIRLSNVSPEIKEKIKSAFNSSDFLQVPDNLITLSLTTWFSDCLKSIENENISNKKKIGGAGERKGFNQMPLFSDEIFKELPLTQINAAIELIKITQQVDITDHQIISLWAVFKVQNLTGNKFYESIDKVYNHFTNWSKSQKFTNGQSVNGSKLGTSAARVDALKKW